ncbi:5-hydroxytryptamine receptor 7 [Saguinus oedipus]|uniref:5-hydroxytryptamine receptor 7 n=1 Tax=Saguinus oedipus TaxID=9490 RepID=A0ABQ9UWZ2_SAGOE|nr:5-hydroxytryptamine receptor 7 [Saguinus oedipus]
MDVKSSCHPDLHGRLGSFLLLEVGRGLPNLSPDAAPAGSRRPHLLSRVPEVTASLAPTWDAPSDNASGRREQISYDRAERVVIGFILTLISLLTTAGNCLVVSPPPTT